MATASATLSSATITAAVAVSPARSNRVRAPKVSYVSGLSSFNGLKAQNSITNLGLPVSADQAFAKIVCSLRDQPRGSKSGGGGSAMAATCNATAEIFKIAAIMNGITLVGVAIGFVLLRIEAAIEDAAE